MPSYEPLYFITRTVRTVVMKWEASNPLQRFLRFAPEYTMVRRTAPTAPAEWIGCREEVAEERFSTANVWLAVHRI